MGAEARDGGGAQGLRELRRPDDHRVQGRRGVARRLVAAEVEHALQHGGHEEHALDVVLREHAQRVGGVEVRCEVEGAAERDREQGEDLRRAVVERRHDEVALAEPQGEALEDACELTGSESGEVAHGALGPSGRPGGVDHVAARRACRGRRPAVGAVGHELGIGDLPAGGVGRLAADHEAERELGPRGPHGARRGQRRLRHEEHPRPRVGDEVLELRGGRAPARVYGSGTHAEEREPGDDVLGTVLRGEQHGAAGADAPSEPVGEAIDLPIDLGVGTADPACDERRPRAVKERVHRVEHADVRAPTGQEPHELDRARHRDLVRHPDGPRHLQEPQQPTVGWIGSGLAQALEERQSHRTIFPRRARNASGRGSCSASRPSASRRGTVPGNRRIHSHEQALCSHPVRCRFHAVLPRGAEARGTAIAGGAMIRLVVNGVAHDLAPEPERSLLAALRDELGLTGAKYGCGEGECGACMVLVAGVAMPACRTRLAEVAGRAVTTIEGLAREGALHPVQRAFVELAAMQCGYCTPGMIVSALALLARDASPTDAEIRVAMERNLCRCGAYPRILAAVRRAAELMR